MSASGAVIPCPGVNTEILAKFFQQVVESKSDNSVIGMFNLFSGGALENCAVFTLGIIPYISASIMLQLMTAVVPSLGKLAREEGGRPEDHPVHPLRDHRLSVSSRVTSTPASSSTPSTVSFSPVSATVTAKYGPLVPDPGLTFEITTMISLLTGTLLLMWLGEQITDKGIGNGISMVITINIVSRLPAALLQGFQMITGIEHRQGRRQPGPHYPAHFFPLRTSLPEPSPSRRPCAR